MKGGPKFEVVGGDYPFGSGSGWRRWEWQFSKIALSKCVCVVEESYSDRKQKDGPDVERLCCSLCYSTDVIFFRKLLS